MALLLENAVQSLPMRHFWQIEALQKDRVGKDSSQDKRERNPVTAVGHTRGLLG